MSLAMGPTDEEEEEVIDITLGSYGLLDSITGWEVSLEPSLSDHRHILFILRGSVPVPDQEP